MQHDLAGYLGDAQDLAEKRLVEENVDIDGCISAGFDALRWFDLPAGCLRI